MSARYTTRETVSRALDIAVSLLAHQQVDRLIESASRSVDAFCARRPEAFAPVTATRTFDWPSVTQGAAYRLWLDDHSLASVSTLSSAGTEIVAADYFLRPDAGPPFTHVEIDRASSASFGGASTSQRSISITGVWGVQLDERPIGAIAEDLDGSETEVLVSAGAAAELGAGAILRCGDERMTVTDTWAVDTTVNAGGALTASLADRQLAVADGTAFARGETLLIDSERVLVADVAGNTLILQRAIDGTAVSAHLTGADIYAYRSLTVVRGALGTTAAAHSTSAALSRHYPPAPVEQLTIAYTLQGLGAQGGGYATSQGQAESSRNRTDVKEIERQVWDAYGRKLRHRAV